jgi:DNA-binding CsgD family transcriptional regulator
VLSTAAVEPASPLHLTRRQGQVLGLVAEGLTACEVGERLGISARTVRMHIEALKRKLGVDRVHALPCAYRVLTGDDPFLLGPAE